MWHGKIDARARSRSLTFVMRFSVPALIWLGGGRLGGGTLDGHDRRQRRRDEFAGDRTSRAVPDVSLARRQGHGALGAAQRNPVEQLVGLRHKRRRHLHHRARQLDRSGGVVSILFRLARRRSLLDLDRGRRPGRRRDAHSNRHHAGGRAERRHRIFCLVRSPPGHRGSYQSQTISGQAGRYDHRHDSMHARHARPTRCRPGS